MFSLNVFSGIDPARNLLRYLISFGMTLLIAFIASLNLSAQHLSEIENRYEALQKDIIKEKFILDSLTQSLEERAEMISAEKGMFKPNQDKIVKLMAGSVTISNAVESQQNKLLQLEKVFEETKQKLYEHYTALVDSFQTLNKSGITKTKEKQIDEQILIVTEKKLLVAPKVKQLSFIPEKILEIDLNKTKDTLQKNIYTEYLTTALNEVNSLLNQVNETSSEIAQIITLHKKASRFLEEVEFENPIKPVGATSNKLNTYDGSIRLSDERGSEFSSQLHSYLSLNNQLNFRHSSSLKITGETVFTLSDDRIRLKDYQELLRELKKRLLDYRAILSHKLNLR